MTVKIDPRLLSTWDGKAHGWSIAAGDYAVSVGASSRSQSATSTVSLKAQALPVSPHAK